MIWATARRRIRPGRSTISSRWAAVTRASLGAPELAPREFWDLTPAELALMLGIEPGGGAQAMTRGRLADLAAKFPD